jgi:hypothetical protein
MRVCCTLKRDGDFVLAEDALGLGEHQLPIAKQLGAVTEVRESLGMRTLAFGVSVTECWRSDGRILNCLNF